MLTMPISDSAQFIVIEPGNITRMKEGRPLKVELPNGSFIMIAFVPDMHAFVAALGLDTGFADVPKGGKKEARNLNISPEQIQTALEKAAKWPEVER